MPYTYEFVDEADDCIVATWRDSYRYEEILGFYSEILEHPKFHVGQNRLFDFRSVRISLSQDQTQRIKSTVGPMDHQHGRRNVALLVGDDASYGVMRQFMMAVAPANVSWIVTRDAEKAATWVSLPAGYVLPADFAKV